MNPDVSAASPSPRVLHYEQQQQNEKSASSSRVVVISKTSATINEQDCTSTATMNLVDIAEEKVKGSGKPINRKESSNGDEGNEVSSSELRFRKMPKSLGYYETLQEQKHENNSFGSLHACLSCSPSKSTIITSQRGSDNNNINKNGSGGSIGGSAGHQNSLLIMTSPTGCISHHDSDSLDKNIRLSNQLHLYHHQSENNYYHDQDNNNESNENSSCSNNNLILFPTAMMEVNRNNVNTARGENVCCSVNSSPKVKLMKFFIGTSCSSIGDKNSNKEKRDHHTVSDNGDGDDEEEDELNF